VQAPQGLAARLAEFASRVERYKKDVARQSDSLRSKAGWRPEVRGLHMQVGGGGKEGGHRRVKWRVALHYTCFANCLHVCFCNHAGQALYAGQA
jgi:hypothetical protein